MKYLVSLLLLCCAASAQVPPMVMQDLLVVASRPSGLPNVTDGLVGWWKLDEGTGSTAADSSGLSNNGTLTNSPTWATGQIGGALAFNGSSQYAYMTNVVEGTNKFSAFCWVKSTTTTLNASILSGHYSAALNKRAWRLHYGSASTGTLSATMTSDGLTPSGGNSKTYMTPLNTFNNGAWAHFGITWNAGTLTMFTNGVPVAPAMSTDATFTNVFPSSEPCSIACVNPSTGGTTFGDVTVDDVRIYNRALSASEVQTIYNWRP